MKDIFEFFCNSFILPELTGESKIKNCFQWGLNPGHVDHHANALLTVSGRYVLGRKFLERALFKRSFFFSDWHCDSFYHNKGVVQDSMEVRLQQHHQLSYSPS